MLGAVVDQLFAKFISECTASAICLHYLHYCYRHGRGTVHPLQRSQRSRPKHLPNRTSKIIHCPCTGQLERSHAKPGHSVVPVSPSVSAAAPPRCQAMTWYRLQLWYTITASFVHSPRPPPAHFKPACADSAGAVLAPQKTEEEGGGTRGVIRPTGVPHRHVD